jgi:hypothetical protein
MFFTTPDLLSEHTLRTPKELLDTELAGAVQFTNAHAPPPPRIGPRMGHELQKWHLSAQENDLARCPHFGIQTLVSAGSVRLELR